MFPSDASKNVCYFPNSTFKRIYFENNFENLRTVKDKFKMFGSISKDSPNVESSVPLYYIAREKIARSNKM